MFNAVIKETYSMLRSHEIDHWVPIFPVAVVLSVFDHLRVYSYIPDNILMSLVSTAFSAVLAITTHRLVLLGESSVPRFGFGMWSKREVLFIGYMIGLNLLIAVPVAMVTVLLIPLVGVTIELPILGSYGLFILMIAIPVLVVASRFCLVLPATAVDDPLFFSGSWRLTIGNGLPVFFLFCILPIGLALPALVLFLLEHEAIYFLASLVGSAGLVLGIMVLSKTYQRLINYCDMRKLTPNKAMKRTGLPVTFSACAEKSPGGACRLSRR